MEMIALTGALVIDFLMSIILYSGNIVKPKTFFRIFLIVNAAFSSVIILSLFMK